MSTAQVTIGGEVIDIPPLNFKTLKRVYPIIKKMEAEEISEGPRDDLASMDLVIEFLSEVLAGSKKPMTTEQLEEALLVSEMLGLQPSVNSILAANKLTAPPGESKAGEEAEKPLTGTSTRSSVKSSPASAQPTGT